MLTLAVKTTFFFVLVTFTLGYSQGIHGGYFNSHYVDFYQGTEKTTVILSVPHDGWKRPSGIASRERGCYDSTTKTCDWDHDCSGHKDSRKCGVSTGADLWSAKLAMEIRAKIAEVTGETPHMIVSQLHRSKMDPNREREEAAQGDFQAEYAFDTYHGFIEKAQDLVKKTGNPGIQFDIHGYSSHPDLWFELGYLIDNEDLDRGKLRRSESSIKSLAERVDVSFEEILRGETSLGGMFQAAGYKAIPSPQYPGPGSGFGGKYYRGGYTTQRWGSRDGGNIDCIQMELPPEPRTYNMEHGPRMGQVMGEFVKKYYSGEDM
ncbi:hypothetical protein ACHWQZ_G013244 [Mnemiopsis leidyi]